MIAELEARKSLSLPKRKILRKRGAKPAAGRNLRVKVGDPAQSTLEIRESEPSPLEGHEIARVREDLPTISDAAGYWVGHTEQILEEVILSLSAPLSSPT